MSDTDSQLAALGFSLSAQYVKPDHVDKDTQLHWRVALAFNDRGFWEGDFRAGRGHCPGYRRNLPRHEKEKLLHAELKTGLRHFCAGIGHMIIRYRVNGKSIPILPKLSDVVASLLLDSRLGEVLFDDFCSVLGLDTDSRKAYETWLLCVDTAAKLRRLPDDVKAKLETILQNY